jgi:hypothetical protein
MTTGASRISLRLDELVRALARSDLPAAEIWRRVASAAESRGVARPSYECVRRRVRDERRRRARAGPSTAEILLEVSTRARPLDAILEHVSGVGVPPLDGA